MRGTAICSFCNQPEGENPSCAFCRDKGTGSARSGRESPPDFNRPAPPAPPASPAPPIPQSSAPPSAWGEPQPIQQGGPPPPAWGEPQPQQGGPPPPAWGGPQPQQGGGSSGFPSSSRSRPTPGLADVRNWVGGRVTSARDAVQRFRNKEFLDAVVAGCALVSAADGHVDASEKQKMIGFIQRSEALKVFETGDVIRRFNHFVSGFEFDAVIGKGEALKSVAKIKKDPEAGRMLVRVCCAIGQADGQFDADERRVVGEVCRELLLNPAEFDL